MHSLYYLKLRNKGYCCMNSRFLMYLLLLQHMASESAATALRASITTTWQSLASNRMSQHIFSHPWIYGAGTLALVGCTGRIYHRLPPDERALWRTTYRNTIVNMPFHKKWPPLFWGCGIIGAWGTRYAFNIYQQDRRSALLAGACALAAIAYDAYSFINLTRCLYTAKREKSDNTRNIIDFVRASKYSARHVLIDPSLVQDPIIPQPTTGFTAVVPLASDTQTPSKNPQSFPLLSKNSAISSAQDAWQALEEADTYKPE
jgi:hypothetical protein